MILLTHNSLKCRAKGVNDGYPLKLSITKMSVTETTPNFEFLKDILPNLVWEGVLIGAEAVFLARIIPVLKGYSKK